MRFLEKIMGGNSLYYPGCLTKFVARDLEEKYEGILRKLNVEFIALSELELCCGSPALKAGYDQAFRDLAEKNLEIFKDHAVHKIITNCPACFMNFIKYYREALGDRWDIQVEHISQTIVRSRWFRNREEETGNPKQKTVTYHDPCHLGRQMGVYEEPREIIRAFGYELVEMELHNVASFCCGGGGGVRTNEPALSNNVARDRLDQARRTGADILCTACPLCYMHLKENSRQLDVVELADLCDLG